MRPLRAVLVMAVAAIAAAMVPSGTYAVPCNPSKQTCRSPGGSTTSGGVNGDTLTAGALKGIDIAERNNYHGPGAQPIAAPVDYEPPACWLYRDRTPAEQRAALEQVWALDGGSVGHEWVLRSQDYYVNQHHNFEIAQTGKGMWWGWYVNPGAAPEKVTACNVKADFSRWVLNGETPPPADGGLTPEQLAMIALSRVRVPPVRLAMSPAGQQTVNLGTWMWLDGSMPDEVSVTATLVGTGVSSTVTARPERLAIDPGTSQADVYTSGCGPHGGQVGVPYTKGASGAPPCGVVYRHASTRGPYPLTAKLTWKVDWTSSQTAGAQPLTDAESASPPDPVNVQEIQTVVVPTR